MKRYALTCSAAVIGLLLAGCSGANTGSPLPAAAQPMHVERGDPG